MNMNNAQLLDAFVAQYREGAHGAEMDCDAAQALALAIEEIQTVMAELYQVIGALSFFTGTSDHPDVDRALDNASDQMMTHTDLLPWPKTPIKTFLAKEVIDIISAAPSLDENGYIAEKSEIIKKVRELFGEV